VSQQNLFPVHATGFNNFPKRSRNYKFRVTKNFHFLFSNFAILTQVAFDIAYHIIIFLKLLGLQPEPHIRIPNPVPFCDFVFHIRTISSASGGHRLYVQDKSENLLPALSMTFRVSRPRK